MDITPGLIVVYYPAQKQHREIAQRSEGLSEKSGWLHYERGSLSPPTPRQEMPGNASYSLVRLGVYIGRDWEAQAVSKAWW
jgi:hypothetical protein